MLMKLKWIFIIKFYIIASYKKILPGRVVAVSVGSVVGVWSVAVVSRKSYREILQYDR